jgi:hypothetical protein
VITTLIRCPTCGDDPITVERLGEACELTCRCRCGLGYTVVLTLHQSMRAAKAGVLTRRL